MSARAGLPIAAHLALLVALACAAAFILSVAVVIWLPPRPPDVMRGDQVVEQFADGFEHVRDSGALPDGGPMRWRISDTPPAGEGDVSSRVLGVRLAQRLSLRPSAVRVAARAARSDVFVFRVREIEHHPLNAEEIREHVIRLHEAHRVEQLEGLSEAQRTAVRDRIERARRQIERLPAPPPGQPAPVDPPAPVAIPAPPAPPDAPEPPMAPLFVPSPGVVLMSGFEIAGRLPDGRWLVMSQGRNWAELGWIARAALMIGATLAVLTLLALLFARRLAAPIQSFADAVQAVGVDPHSAPAPEQGPRELRAAARAVNAMQARLRSLIADRTKTLASVAHDMRTPLMRLRLAAENVAPEQRERMAKEIAEVEALVASFIAFARDDPAEEARVRLDLGALLQSLVDDHAEAGRAASFEGDARVVLTGQSLGLKRLFGNLIDNALKYGGAARVRLSQADGFALVDIEDDGPGVPAAQREAVFKPFVRLDANAAGAGLGLAAARSIARAHGGDIVFLDSEHGAHARVTLPL